MDFTQVVTLYTLVKSEDGSTALIRNKLSEVLYTTKTSTDVSNGVFVNKTVLKVSIPKTDMLRSLYVTPKEYSKLSIIDKAKVFTIDKDMLVIKGDVVVKEYIVEEIKKNYEVYTVYGIDDYDVGELAHWNIYAS